MHSLRINSVSPRSSTRPRCPPSLDLPLTAARQSAPMPTRVFFMHPAAATRCLAAIVSAAIGRRARRKPSVHAAYRCIVLANRRTVSHNRDEFENGSRRQRAGEARTLPDSAAGRAQRTAVRSRSQTPRRQLTRFDATTSGAMRQMRFPTRARARRAVRRNRSITAMRSVYVNWRA